MGEVVEDNVLGEDVWASLRWERNRKLATSDWVEHVTLPDQHNWDNYRQALRDIPSDFASPKDVVWPIKPKQ